MLNLIWKPSDIPLPVFVKRPKSLLTDDTNKFRRNICSTHHSLGRRLDPLDRKQQIHSLRHPAVLLSLVVVLQPFLLRQVHVTTVAAVFSIWSENCGLLSAEAALKEEGRGRGLNLCKKLIPSCPDTKMLFSPHKWHTQVPAVDLHSSPSWPLHLYGPHQCCGYI